MYGDYVEFELGGGEVVRVYDVGVVVGLLRRADRMVSVGVYVKPSLARMFVEEVAGCVNGLEACGDIVISADLVRYNTSSKTLYIEHAGMSLAAVVHRIRAGNLLDDAALARQWEEER